MVKIRTDVRNVYDAMFDILYREFNSSHLAYEHLLEFLAADNCPPILNDIESRVEWFFNNPDLNEKLIKNYDMSLIKKDRYDHLGDIYVGNVIGPKEAGRKGLYLTPQPVVDTMCQMTLDRTNKKVNILEPCVGSGRFLITANEYCPNARLFGVDESLDMIRTAFTNAAIHNISMYLLHANSLKHETDISRPDGLYNWKHANRWQSQIDKLKPITIEKSAPKQTEPKEQKPIQYQLFGK